MLHLVFRDGGRVYQMSKGKKKRKFQAVGITSPKETVSVHVGAAGNVLCHMRAQKGYKAEQECGSNDSAS